MRPLSFKKALTILVLIILFSLTPPNLYSQNCYQAFENKEGTMDLSSLDSLKIALNRPSFNPQKLSSVVLSNDQVYGLGKLLGYGDFSVVYCLRPSCKRVIKIPTSLASLNTFEKEFIAQEELRKAKISFPSILNPSKNLLYLIKPRIFGKSAQQLFEEDSMLEIHVASLAELFVKAYKNNIPLDVKKAENFIWSKRRGTFILVDMFLLNKIMGSSIVNIADWHTCFFRGNTELNNLFNKHLRILMGKEYEMLGQDLNRRLESEHAKSFAHEFGIWDL